MESKTWYSARLLFMSSAKGGQMEIDPLSEESIILIRADKEENARKSARKAALKMQHDYENEEGQQIAWKFVDILELQDLCEQSLDTGTEVFSRLFWKSQAESSEVRELLKNKPSARRRRHAVK